MIRKLIWFVLIVMSPGTVWAQTPPPEAQTCASIVVVFADGFARAARKNAASVEPVLVVANILDADDVATITVHPTNGPDIVRVVSLPGKKRATVDLFAVVGRVDTDFSVEVAFGAFGTADLKMWQAGHATTSQGLTLCR